MGKKWVSILLAVGMILCSTAVSVASEQEDRDPQYLETALREVAPSTDVVAPSAILMEQATGEVLFEKNADELRAPASITKIMTLLLVMEALDSGKINLEDKVTCSPHANSMGGSQIWLEIGEQMTVHELLKATAIASANDGAAALAEHIAGSEEAFVDMMNKRAKELQMNNTTFKNCTGLDAEGHLTTARDVAIMGRELMKHEKIKEYTTTWMDTLRGGQTQLVNTNKLVRFYKGATGLKTGTTDLAGRCLAATATKGDMSLVTVVMGCQNKDDQFNSARSLLDYGYANYGVCVAPNIDDKMVPVRVEHGILREAEIYCEYPAGIVLPKGDKEKITQEITLSETVQAPVEQGQTVGKVTLMIDGKMVMEYPIKAKAKVDKMTVFHAMGQLMKEMVAMN